ncbi:MAG: DUF4062 domain-containing protein [Eubacteriales bacterium]
MATPKIFVSSTCYDLKQIRQDLYIFIDSYGYIPILSDYNGVTYNTTDTLESDCYNEISTSDIVIGIIGGRYGAEAHDKDGQSISMKEMEKAIEANKQIYIFIDKNVYGEFETYKANIPNEIKYVYVDNVKIYEFISTLKRKNNIIITGFSTANDITSFLKSQWAGLFQTFLNNREYLRQAEGITTLRQIAEALNETNKKYLDLNDKLSSNIKSYYSVSTYGNYQINPLLVKLSITLHGDGAGFILIKNKTELIKYMDCIGYDNFQDENAEDAHLYFSNNFYRLKIFSPYMFDKNHKLINIDNLSFNKLERENDINTFILEKLYNDADEPVDEDSDFPF